MFPVFRDHALPDAPLLFTSGPLPQAEAIGTLQGEPLYHASLGPGEYRLLLGRKWFSTSWPTQPKTPIAGGHTVWLGASPLGTPPGPSGRRAL